MLGKAAIAVLYAAPLAWVACLAAFVFAVTLKVGHFPSYSNPDPKHVAGLGLLHETAVMLLFLALLSPVVLGIRAGSALLREGASTGRRWVSRIYFAGLALAAVVMFGDAFGLMTWLLD